MNSDRKDILLRMRRCWKRRYMACGLSVVMAAAFSCYQSSVQAWSPSTTSKSTITLFPRSSWQAQQRPSKLNVLSATVHNHDSTTKSSKQPTPRASSGKNNNKGLVTGGGGGSKFAQPAFSSTKKKKDRSVVGNENNQPLDRSSANKTTRSRSFGGDSRIATLHSERLKTAGREGTKRYRNPNKVFLGNLPFSVTSAQLEEWLSQQLAVPAPLLLKQCKVITDWQTQESKGYGFAVFTQTIYATVCLEKCHGKRLEGRSLQVSPGYKKLPDPAIYLEQKRQKAKDREEAAIQNGIGMADATTAAKPENEEEKRRARMTDPMEIQMLMKLDPDLIDYGNEEEDDENDVIGAEDDSLETGYVIDNYDGDAELLEGEDWASDVDGNDGDSDDDDVQSMNRQRRREAARKKKKRKVSNKGFG